MEVSLESEKDLLGEKLLLEGRHALELRYGENPHQKAALYALEGGDGLLPVQLQGKQLSYTNLLDASKALEIAREFEAKEGASCTIIKHANPCGGALGLTPAGAFEKAFATDPLAAFGGVIAFNAAVDGPVAEKIFSHFFEVVAAPGFSQEALDVFSRKKNLRVLDASAFFAAAAARKEKQVECRSTAFGLLVQERDGQVAEPAQFTVPTKATPTEEQVRTMLFAMKYAKHASSNAIVLAMPGQAIGFGAGQTSRVESVKIAISKAGENGFSLQGAALASDAFFPFRDSIDLACSAGIRAIMQPGGSVRDEEIVKAADEAGAAMVVTGIRHFRH